MNIAIIGSGNVGSALAQGLYKAGHTIFFGVRDAASAKAEKASGLVSNAKIVSVAEASKQGEVIIITRSYLKFGCADGRCLQQNFS
jgi:predicted dinucleotide-binding enzyme